MRRARAGDHGPGASGLARLARLGAVALLVAACSGGPILANPPLGYPSPAPATAAPVRPADPIPVVLPRDDGPHGRLTEWWYYTGHLTASDGRRFGFEAVVFRAERGSLPAAWASHLALTDEAGEAFHYAQRSEVGRQVDRSPRGTDGVPTGFDLQVAGLNPELAADGAPALAAPWRLGGSGGDDRIEAALTPEEAALAGADFGLALDLSALKPATLHDHDGFVDFGAAGSSYYYSRTRLAATGQVELNGETFDVEGIAWFDHQWGDFVSVGGGWDWFAINLDDGTDITISVVHAPDGGAPAQYGTIVAPDGAVRYVDDSGLGVSSLGDWTSEATGRRYPSGWHITIPEFEDGRNLIVELHPTVADQEVDARATTGVIYWEGSHFVTASRSPSTFDQLGGEAYVEITRYEP